jgi:ribonuclease R
MPRKATTGDRREALLSQLVQAKGGPLSAGDLMQRARIHPGERTGVKRTLRDLTREGVLRRDGKRFALASAPAGGAAEAGAERSGSRAGGKRPALRGRGVLGTLTRHRDGFGFVARVDRAGEDLFVPPDEAAKALDGDLVRVEIVPGTRGRTMGRIVEVVERRRRLLIGTYHAGGRQSFVVPADRALEGVVPVPETRLARDGEAVKVAIEATGKLAGSVVERIGAPGEPRVEVLRTAYAKGFADIFPEEVVLEAGTVPDRVRPEDWEGRRDLTALRLVTIDGEDARDFDDAVYVERLQGHGKERGGYRLVVAIADVSHYVRAGSALDAEALRRGTSVYFPMQVLPMLPERLSNGICSLNPEVERLCVVADLRIDAQGHPLGTEVYPAVMRSAARCTYTEVARALEGERVPSREVLRDDFELMGELQEKLTAMRRLRGSIDFDLPEAHIVLGEAGQVLGIEKRPRNRAHRVVEEFMLAANEAVARWFGDRELPTIYRVHGLPDEEKLAGFLDLARAHGFEMAEEAPGPRALNALLGRFRGHAQERALNQLLLRAMMQAVYSPENIGHYGLAAEHYLHFTSPIRRYPDLVVHRLMRQVERWRGEKEERRTRAEDLAEIAALASERERAAMQAEREIAAYYAALFMQDKVGERFDGVVSTVVDFGLFVELKRWFVEGLVKAEDLGEGFELDPEAHALVERRSGRAFRVGDEVQVELLAATPVRRQIDLGLVEAGEVRRADRAGVPRRWSPAPGGSRGKPPAGGRRVAGGKAARAGQGKRGRSGGRRRG